MPQLLEISGGFFSKGLGQSKKRKARKSKAKKARKAKAKRMTRKSKKARAKKPVSAIRSKVEMKKATKPMVRSARKTVRTASMKKAVAQSRLSLLALSAGRWESAGNLAINAAIEAVASFRQSPVMAARIMSTSRGVVKFAIKKMRRRSV